MTTRIERLPFPMASCYLLQEQGTILIDGGPPGQAKRILAKLGALSLNPKDISLIVVTHSHWDHIGSLHELKTATGCKVAVNHREKDWVERPPKTLPPALNLWGRIVVAAIRVMANSARFPGTNVDLVLEDTPFPASVFRDRGESDSHSGTHLRIHDRAAGYGRCHCRRFGL